jgi:hypothetical protein
MLEISHSNVLKLCLWQKQEVEALASQLIELEKYLISFPISSANLFLHDSSPHICPIGLVARLYFKKCNPCIIYWGLLATASRIFRILQYSCDCDRLPAPSPPFPPQSVTPPPPYPSLRCLTWHIATASPLTVILIAFPTAAFQVWPHPLLVLVKSSLWPHAFNRRSPKSTMSVFNLT